MIESTCTRTFCIYNIYAVTGMGMEHLLATFFRCSPPPRSSSKPSIAGFQWAHVGNMIWLVVSTYPSEKWWSSSVGMIIPNIWEKWENMFETTNQITSMVIWWLVWVDMGWLDHPGGNWRTESFSQQLPLNDWFNQKMRSLQPTLSCSNSSSSAKLHSSLTHTHKR